MKKELRLLFLFVSFNPQTNLSNLCPHTNRSNFWQNRDRPHCGLSLAAAETNTAMVIGIIIVDDNLSHNYSGDEENHALQPTIRSIVIINLLLLKFLQEAR